MTPDIEKIEHLLNAKSFEELTSSERKLVLAHVSGKAEYDHMRETLLRVKKVFSSEAQAISADAAMKEQILNRFEQNKPRAVPFSEQVNIFFQTLIPSPVGRFSAVLGVLLVVIVIGYFALPNKTMEVAHQLPAAKNENAKVMTNDSVLLKPVGSKTAELSDDIVVGNKVMEISAPARGEVAPADEVLLESDVPMEMVVPQTMPVQEERNKAMDTEKKEEISGTYMNSNGYMQYDNNRSVLVQKPKSNTFKEANQDKKTSGKKDKSVMPVAGSTAGRVDDQDLKKNDASRNEAPSGAGMPTMADSEGKSSMSPITYSIPGWDGYENSGDVNYLTAEKIKHFLLKELTAVTVEQLEGQQVKLSLTFNENGKVTKGKVLGISTGMLADVNKAEIEAQTLKLPTFKFSGNGGQKLLEQVYRINF